VLEAGGLSVADGVETGTKRPGTPGALHAAFDRDALLVRGVGELSVVGVVLVGVGDGEVLSSP
jgi:hypothetical protein